MRERIEAAIAPMLSLIQAGHSLVLTLSGGKDSMSTTLLGLEAIRRAQEAGVPQAKHYVTSSDTLIENPSMGSHLLLIHQEIEAYCDDIGLPVEIKMAVPALAKQFVVSTLGRGTLLRTPETGTKDGKRVRACSEDWKVAPQTRLAKALQAEVAVLGFLEPVAVLGTRFSESSSRGAAMTERGESALTPVRGANGALTLSPIADWDTVDVWEFLGMFNNARLKPFEAFVSGRSIDRMMELYRDANEGTCGVIIGDGGNRSACGSRFGCAFCGITGERDKSMESMLKEPKYAHLAGLNAFRNYLVRSQWDLSKRELVGRTLSPAGCLKVKPDVYSFSHRLALLRMLLTLDVLEQERAEAHEAALFRGDVPDTEEHRELATTQFQMVTPQQLVAIDFQLSLHHYAPHAHPALAVWHEVYALGRRYAVPEVESLKKPAIPAAGWFFIGDYDAQVPTDGLRSYTDELWNGHRHPERVLSHRVTPQGEQVVWFDEETSLSVDAAAATEFVTCVYDTPYMLETQYHTGLEAARFWLNEGIVKLAKGTAGKYQEMARRGQYFAHLADRLNLAPADLDAYLVKHAISDKEHTARLQALKVEAEASNPQLSLLAA